MIEPMLIWVMLIYGVKGLIQPDRPWVVTIWCLAHRLELAIREALKNKYFSEVDNFLLQVYYVYSKSPKKCKELEDVVSELKGCLNPSEFPDGSGVRGYLNHLLALIENPTTKPVDRQKLKGYITKWRDCKVLLGCALFHDTLKPTAILCKSFQADEISVVSTIEAILRTSASMKKLKTTEMQDFPSVKKVLLRLKDDLP